MTAFSTPDADVNRDPSTRIDPVVEYFVDQRGLLGAVLVAIGLAFFFGSVYSLYKAFSSEQTEVKKNDADKDKSEKDKAEKEKTEKDKDKEKEDDKPSIRTPKQFDFLLGGICGIVASLIGLGLGGHMSAALPKLTRDENRADARMYILFGGVLYGLILMFTSFTFFVSWIGSLMKLIGSQDLVEAKWVLGPILGFLVGGGLIFLSTFPARAQERNNPRLRRAIYGANFALTTMLLLVVLMFVNIMTSVRVPNMLDTTQSGLYTLTISDATKEFITNLDQTVVVRTILPIEESSFVHDTQRLLSQCRELNPERFIVKELSLTRDRSELLTIVEKYPQFKIVSGGILLTLERDDKQAAFINLTELVKSDSEPGSRERKISFQGEIKLAQELVSLTEKKKSRTVVYFTQESQELSIEGTRDTTEDRTARELKSTLEKAGCTVLPLKVENDKVPEDASMVVVADPLIPLSAKIVGAIEKYMAIPSTESRKTKLIVLAGAHSIIDPSKQSAKIPAIGLEQLLNSFGIDIEPKIVYGIGNEQMSSKQIQVHPARDENPVSKLYHNAGMIFRECRPIHTVPNPTRQDVQTRRFIVGYEPPYCWTEDEMLKSPDQMVMDIARSEELQKKKGLRLTEQELFGVYAMEANAPRVLVIANGSGFSDEACSQNSAPSLIFNATVNWMRDRPAIANVAAKQYGLYRVRQDASQVSLILVPIVATLLTIVALGLGMWAFRRS